MMNHDYNFKGMALRELIQLFGNNIWEDNDAYLDDVAMAIARQGGAGVEYLSKILHTDDAVRQRAAIFGITQSQLEQRQIVRLVLPYLYSENACLVSEVIDSLQYLHEFSYWKSIKPLMSHKSEFVRGAVLRYARSALTKDDAFLILLTGLGDSHFIVIENAIDELDELGNSSAVEFIQPFLAHSHPDVRQAAQTAIKNLSNKEE